LIFGFSALFRPLPIHAVLAAGLKSTEKPNLCAIIARQCEKCGLGVLWGYGTRDELETAGADQLVDFPADLARTVLSMAP
jgi:phosphoglycolate phosphatase-like HAD superfamily hydrolase